MSDNRYEMRVKKNEFAPFPFKDSYSIKSIEKFKEGEYHLNKIVESIDQKSKLIYQSHYKIALIDYEIGHLMSK